METPRRRSLIEKLLRRSSPEAPAKDLDHETQSTTGLIDASNPHPTHRTITLPLTGGGTETLVVPNDQVPRDPNNNDPESWKFHLGARKASVAASDTGDKAAGASDVEKAQYKSLMEQTKGMTAEQVHDFLKKRGTVDGGKVMRRWEEGKTGEGYMQVVGADRGTF